MGGAGKQLLALQRDGFGDRCSDIASAWHMRRQTTEEVGVGVMFGAETGFSVSVWRTTGLTLPVKITHLQILR